MGVKKKYAKGRLDKYYHMAKEQGYRARSAFKLIQLNKKYNFLERAKCLVDLCAAPGGWLQVASKYMPKPNIIIGLDLAPIKPIPGVITHVEDITTQKCRATLKGELKTWKVDVFLHDGAPNVGTSWLQDAFTQSELVLASLKLATEFLVPGGVFVTKVFRSKDYNKLMWVFNQLFTKVEATKPASSRNVSAEIFVVCRDFIAPKKVDPRLLDAKYVFKEVDDTPDAEMDDKKRKERQGALLNDLFHPEKRRRHRTGYADGDYTLNVETSIADFVKGPDFLSVLTTSNRLRFDKDEFGGDMLRHPLTTEEIKSCCEDLKVLGKKDFKDLLKWREAIRLDLGLEQKKETEAVPEEAKEETEESLMEKLDAEAKAAAAKLKREKRKARERKAKQLVKLRFGMQTADDIGLEASEAGGLGMDDEALFKLNGLTSGIKVPAPATTHMDISSDEDDLESGSDEDEESDYASAYDSDDDVEQKVDHLESELDGLYQAFKERQLQRDPRALVKQKKLDKKAHKSSQAFEEWYGVEYEKKRKRSASSGEDSDASGSDDSDSDAASVDEDSKPALSKRAKVFFDNPLFKKLDAPSDANGSAKTVSKVGLFAEEMDTAWSDSDDEDAVPQAVGGKVGKGKTNVAVANDDEDEDSDFDVVPAALDGDGTPADKFAITTAEAYTLAQRMISKSGKRDLLDGSFNRYTFNDPENIPSWFVEDEGRHNKPRMPVTKEAVTHMRDRMRALDARPIKKVAEAKFRKQMRLQRRIEKMQKKAANVMEDEGGELTEKAKLTQIAKMVKKAKGKVEKKKVEVVVAKGANRGNKGRPKGIKGRYKMVDGRMKKDMRAAKRLAKKTKKKRS
ncbi:Spb1 C-terminal domain-containing protein [Gaertneriomyces semiglobifer]|nr:Spb1 C-terminal domain-containing protein [Gaertneriomyces semiglobifer]